tara:strand:+ start:409 stop:1224 length:816 start_codon:yes stop_codon:yes gene_type:complete
MVKRSVFQPKQAEFNLAIVNGEEVSLPSDDLYIPPNALKIFLESFEGPLDLLLYFIKKQNLNILEIDVSRITDQYVQYIELMEKIQFDLVGEYLVMAAYLTEIKSRMMLPKEFDDENEEDDPRAELIRRLQEYERYKEASNKIEKLPRVNRDFYIASSALPEFESKENFASVDLSQIAQVFAELIERQKLNVNHVIEFEKLSTREKMSHILDLLVNDKYLDFLKICIVEEGKIGIIVNFLALLELVKDSLITLIQSEDFGQIHLSAKEEIH